MDKRKMLGAAALSAALLGGGVTGALIGAPVITGAQESEDDGTSGQERGRPHLEVAAETIGISEDELLDALRDGQSIAQVAEANGVEVQTVVDALVAAAREDLPERITDLVNREGLGRHGHRGHHGHRFGPAKIDAAADAIGIDEEELLDALRDGRSIAQVAEANGVEVQTVVDALVAAATTRIDEAVERGDLEAGRAAELKEGLAERITELVQREGLRRGPGFGDDGPGA